MMIQTLPGELFWGGRVTDGIHMPYAPGFSADLHDPRGNQVSWLLLSSAGRVVWSKKPFRFTVREDCIELEGDAPIEARRVGETLRQACRYAQRTLYPPKKAMPPRAFFDAPQFNTWIELIYDQNEADILRYAEAIDAQQYPKGVLMIDDNWQEDYGVWTFHAGRFPHPKEMIDRLHALGFKVMLWIVPFVSPDCATYRMLRDKGVFVKDAQGKPRMTEWWNGYSAVLDLSNPDAWTWFKGELDALMEKYGVDGFKMDAGGPHFYPEDAVYFKPGACREKQTQLFCEFAAQYPYNELRETINQPHLPSGERLCDKAHRWQDNGLDTLTPNSVAQSLMGYQYICPDMIGGGEYSVFVGGNPRLDRELVVRSAQNSALLPMMQFSLAPWRVLDAEMSEYCRQAALLHQRFADYIVETVEHARATGEPVLRPLEYAYPHAGYARVTTEYLLGEKLLVAPVVEKDARTREVVLPAGKWRADDGTEYAGGQTVTVDAPLSRLPWFEKIG